LHVAAGSRKTSNGLFVKFTGRIILLVTIKYCYR